jgi:hypothetical protein
MALATMLSWHLIHMIMSCEAFLMTTTTKYQDLKSELRTVTENIGTEVLILIEKYPLYNWPLCIFNKEANKTNRRSPIYAVAWFRKVRRKSNFAQIGIEYTHGQL